MTALFFTAGKTHWGPVLPSSEAESNDAPARLAAEVKQKALEDRNAANDPMCLHKQTCSVCTPKLKTTHPSRAKRAEEQKVRWTSGKAGK